MKKLIRKIKRTFILRRRNIIVSGTELVSVLKIVDKYLPSVCDISVSNCGWRDEDMWRIDLFIPDTIWRPIKYEVMISGFNSVLTYKKGYMAL